MILNRTQLALIALITGFSCLFFTGCSKGSASIDGSVAEQVALDAAGVSKGTASDIQTTPTDNGFTISFFDRSGKYKIGIDSAGKVDSYEFLKNEQPEQAPEKPQENSSEEAKRPQQNNAEATGVQLPEGSLSRSELIARMAAFLGINQYDEADFALESATPEQAVMTVKLIDGRVLFTILNPYSGDVLSSGTR